MNTPRRVARQIAGFGLSILLASAAVSAKDVALRLLVTTPPMEPEPAQIYISLSTEGWPEGGRSLTKVAERLYESRMTQPAGSSFAYKFLRDKAWKTVEKDGRGDEIANRTLRVPAHAEEMIVFHDVAMWADQPAGPVRVAKFQSGIPVRLDQGSEESTRSGDIRVHPTMLDEKTQIVREVHVYLPPGYDSSKDRYPVLYMMDGQNLFDRETAFIGVEWGLDEMLEEAIPAGRLPPLIVVGIYNSPDRMNEYTPMRDEVRKAGGGADKLLAFITGTVKPFIDRTYRTQPDRDHTGVGGSSLGGIFALYAVCAKPDVFSRAAVISPACQWADEGMRKFVESAKPPADVRIWMDVGSNEGASEAERSGLQTACRALADALHNRGYTSESNFHFEEVPGAAHNEAAWSARSERILKYLFGT